MKLENQKPVQLVMLVYNALDYVKQAVSSLYDHTSYPFELTIVDNASNEKTREWLTKATEIYPRMNVILNPVNSGFAGGNNIGLRSIEGKKWDWCGLINSDLIFTEGWLTQMMETYEDAKRTTPKIGMIGPVSGAAGGVQGVRANYKSTDEIQTFAIKHTAANAGTYREAYMLVGFCLLIHRDCYEDIGEMDERYSAMWEDNDWCLTMRLKGWRCVVDCSTYIHHWFSKSFQENNIDSRKSFYDNRDRFLEKWTTNTDKSLTAMMRVKNGEDYIERTLTKLSEMCDSIVVLIDQHTTDNTYEIVRKFPKVVRLGKEPPHEYNEAYSRNTILKWAQETECDWIWCLSKDTKIPLVDGTTKTIEELSKLESLDNVYVYSLDKQGKIVPGKLNKVWKTGTRQTLKITLDNNESFRCTTDHRIMLRDGSYVEAGGLKVNDSLMPLYRRDGNRDMVGYEMIYSPGEDKWHYTHREFWKYFNNTKKGLVNKKYLIHHKNVNPRDNTKNNLVKMGRDNHMSLHGREKTPEHLLNVKLACSTPEERKRRSRQNKIRMVALSKEERRLLIEPAQIAALTPKARQKKSETITKIWSLISEEKRSERAKLAWVNTLPEERTKLALRGWETRRANSKAINHKITRIESYKVEDVYDMEIDKHHNFALDCGIFVHNCADHDEVPEDKLIENIQTLLNAPDPMTFLYIFQIVQLWNEEDTYRKDGLWGNFLQGRLFRNLPDQSINNPNDLIHCGSHPIFPPGNTRATYYRIAHYGNVKPEGRQKKYEWYTNTDSDLDINMVLGNWKEYYWKLYYGAPGLEETPEWRILKEDGEEKPRYGNFYRKDAYRHIVDEKNMELGHFTQDISVTLCIIARNEEKHIMDAINSVKEIIDDIVVIDTGSTDSTKSMARSLGAKVFDYEGPLKENGKLENFSDARNISIRKAKTKWVLRIDPDEVIPVQFLRQLYLMLQDDKMDGFMFQIKNFLEEPRGNPYANWVLSETCRLFKNDPDIYYSGYVHEEIDDSLKELLKKRPVSIQKSTITLHHFGYLRGQDFLDGKFEHYCDLNTRQINEAPEDFRAYFSRAVHYFHTAKYDEAIVDYNKTLELNPEHWMAYNDLAVIYQYRGQLDVAMKFFKKAKDLIGPDVHPIHVQKVQQNLDVISKQFNTEIRSRMVM